MSFKVEVDEDGFVTANDRTWVRFQDSASDSTTFWQSDDNTVTLFQKGTSDGRHTYVHVVRRYDNGILYNNTTVRGHKPEDIQRGFNDLLEGVL
jgi:hypothetical protein